MSVFCSLCVFLFSAVSLVVPSGFSYGPAFLVLISLALLYVRPRISFRLHDWIFILTLAGYVLINVLLNVYHGLPANAYDKLLRYLLVIPVYFLLISYPPKQSYFWIGLSVAAFGACAIAIYQKFFEASSLQDGRVTGFMNPIQFGDISILIGGLLLSNFITGKSKKYIATCVLLFLMAFTASFLSSSRGSWLAIPFIFCAVYFSSSSTIKQYLKIMLMFLCLVICIAVVFMRFSDGNILTQRFSQTASEISSYIENKNEYTSLTSRLLLWKNGIDAFKISPIMGWGDIDKIKLEYPDVWYIIHYHEILNHYHNEFINTLAIKGLLGFIALMAMYLIPLYYFVGLIRTRQADVMSFAAAGVVLILCVMVFGLTQCFLAHNSGTMVFVFYLVIIKAYCRNIVAARGEAAS